jgi:TolB protein
MKNLFIVCLCGIILSAVAWADDPFIKISVGQARTKKTMIAFPAFSSGPISNDPEGLLRGIRDIATEDLAFSGLFDFLSPTAFIEDASKAGVKIGTFKFTDWGSIGSEFLLKGTGKISAGKLELEVYLYAVGTGKQLFGKKYSANVTASRKLGHTLANDTMFALTGKKGPFTSKIVFVSDRTGKKELYVMDYDGENPIKVTSRFAHAMAPAWSPDGKKVVFSAVAKNKANVRNHNLYIYDLKSGDITLLSNKPGINSGSTFSADGKRIALTMSFTGNPEIFFLDPITKIAQRITTRFGMDVDPSFSPDGKQLAFVSDRAGRPMVYKMDASGGNLTRLTFAGQYNATPSWSPLGD